MLINCNNYSPSKLRKSFMYRSEYLQNSDPEDEVVTDQFDLSKIDIVIPVYNARDYVKKCIDSLLSSDASECNIICVNDHSDSDTTSLLYEYTPNVVIIDNETNLGYTRSINIGIKSGNAPYVILLNSDTVLPVKWVKRLADVLMHDKTAGLCGPLSNAASYQNIPFLRGKDSEFAINSIPLDMTVDEYNEFIFSISLRSYPIIPVVNGFCYMIKREVINTIGYFDEVNFPMGYGEECDFAFRAHMSGYHSVCADDVFVYHAKSKSFGAARRNIFLKNANEAFQKKYGSDYFAYVDSANFRLHHIRENVIKHIIKRFLAA